MLRASKAMVAFERQVKEMSMTDIASAPYVSTPRCVGADLYAAAFDRRTASLDNALRIRLRRSRAVLVRSRPMITIGGRCIPAAVETLFEQVRPNIWQFRSQMIDIEGPASDGDRQRIHAWSTDRRRHFVSPDGPRMAPVFDTLASVLESGREGRDFVLLNRVPATTSVA